MQPSGPANEPKRPTSISKNYREHNIEIEQPVATDRIFRIHLAGIGSIQFLKILNCWRFTTIYYRIRYHSRRSGHFTPVGRTHACTRAFERLSHAARARQNVTHWSRLAHPFPRSSCERRTEQRPCGRAPLSEPSNSLHASCARAWNTHQLCSQQHPLSARSSAAAAASTHPLCRGCVAYAVDWLG